MTALDRAGTLVRRVWMANRGIVVLVAGYTLLRAVYTLVSEDGGILRASGDIDLPGVLFALLILGLRLVVLFIVPAVLAYRATILVARRRVSRHDTLTDGDRK